MLTELWTWLLAPLSGTSEHLIAPATYWHARLMVLSWALLLPLGILIARFYKVTPKQDFPRVLDNKFWWHTHKASQYAGCVLSLVAYVIAIVWFAPRYEGWLVTTHKGLGYVTLVLMALQLISAWLRGSKGGPTDTQLRGDHFDMTLRRRVFEGWHKHMGYAALFLAQICILLGLLAVDAPRWMFIGLVAMWLGFAGTFTHLQQQGRAIDTYTAIWGKPYTAKHD